MRFIASICCGLLFLSGAARGADSPIELPSSVPVDVFKMRDDQRGIGYIGFNVTLELEDEFFNDKIGDIDFESHGVIYTTPGRGALGLLGEMFELSYTAGVIDGTIRDPTFTEGGRTYDNSYDKDGFYVGIRPSYSTEMTAGDGFTLKSATTLHGFFYNVSGSFSVDNGTNSYRYDEDNYGLAIKPTTIIQATLYPSANLALSVYGGLSTFLALDWVFYDDGAFDEDDELEFLSSGINVILGYDVSYLFENGSGLNLSMIVSQREEDESAETVLRYTFSY